MNKVKLAPNLAMKVAAKYIDLFPGEHGPSVRLKGKFDGEDGVLYLPGNADDSVATLVAAGIIPEYTGTMEPSEAVNLKPKRKEFELILAQPAGEKYGKVQVVGATPATAAAANSTNGSTPPASSGNGHQATPPSVLYAKATDFVLKEIAPKYTAAGIELTDRGIAAMVATVFISKSRDH